jgi:hypothetical protein
MNSQLMKPDQLVSAPNKQGVGRRWWVRIVDLSDCRRFAKVKGGKMAGAPWWVAVDLLETKAEKRANDRRRKAAPAAPQLPPTENRMAAEAREKADQPNHEE